MSLGKTLKNGIISENPTFVQVIAMCPTLAVTTTMFNGAGMGMAVVATLILTNVMISMFRKVIPDKARIPAMIVIIAAIVTMIQMAVQAFMPALDDALGIFIPLIVVNCLILGRGEGFAIKNNMGRSAIDGLGMGLGFAMSLTILATVREIIGGGTLFSGTGFEIMLYPEQFRTLIVILPPGAFITLGLLMAGLKKFAAVRKAKAEKVKSALQPQAATV